MKKTTKTFIGGGVIFGVLGLLIGGFVMAAVLGTAFINYSLKHPVICQPQASIK